MSKEDKADLNAVAKQKRILVDSYDRRYYEDPRGFLRRVDLKGTTRAEAKANKKADRKRRIKALKARDKSNKIIESLK